MELKKSSTSWDAGETALEEVNTEKPETSSGCLSSQAAAWTLTFSNFALLWYLCLERPKRTKKPTPVCRRMKQSSFIYTLFHFLLKHLQCSTLYVVLLNNLRQRDCAFFHNLTMITARSVSIADTCGERAGYKDI